MAKWMFSWLMSSCKSMKKPLVLVLVTLLSLSVLPAFAAKASVRETSQQNVQEQSKIVPTSLSSEPRGNRSPSKKDNSVASTSTSSDNMVHIFPSPLGHQNASAEGGIDDRYFSGTVWTNPVAAYDGLMCAKFVAVENTISGWTSSDDWISVMPINIAYGPSQATYTWIQFGITFYGSGSTQFEIEINQYYDGSMHYGDISSDFLDVHYQIGHTYLAETSVKNSAQVAFSIVDEDTGGRAVYNIDVQSTDVQFSKYAFSPSAMTEVYSSKTPIYLTSFPYFAFDIINGMTDYGDNSGPMGITAYGVSYWTMRIDAGGSHGWWRWATIGDSYSNNLIPQPLISVVYPSQDIYVGDTATIEVYVQNPPQYPSAVAEWMEIAVSFPTLSESAIQIDGAGTTLDEARLHGVGENLESYYGFSLTNQAEIPAICPLISGVSYFWQPGVWKSLKIRITPTSAGRYTFLVKSRAAYQTGEMISWSPNFTSPTNTWVLDQQYECAESYAMSVVHAPVLTEPSSGTLTPNKGDTNTVFTFHVFYYDSDNLSPRFAYVHIDDRDYPMHVTAGWEQHPYFTPWEFSTALSAGVHHYNFLFSLDGYMFFTLPSDGSLYETLPVVQWDFAFYPDPLPALCSVTVGKSTSYQIGVTTYSSASNPDISLSCSSTVPGVTYQFSPSSGNYEFFSTFTVCTSAETPLGTYDLVIMGSGGGQMHSASVRLTVNSIFGRGSVFPWGKLVPRLGYLPILNLGKYGDYFAADIELPEEYGAASVNASSIMVNDTVGVDILGPQPVINETLPVITVYFNRTVLSGYLISKGFTCGNVTLEITGTLLDGTPFQCDTVVAVRMPGDVNFDGKVNLKDVFAAAIAFGTCPGMPTWNPLSDVNEDGKINLIDYWTVCTNWGENYT